MTLTAAQIRRSCALLRWGSPVLAEQSGIAFEIICTAWSDNSVEAMSDADVGAILTALEKAGVRFEFDAAGMPRAVLPRANP